ncbi:hypothetical protein [Acinetobacter tandoii]|uniref:Uncharacterized protein n=1 Tax=Acinetobacter tandoii DSM 14970 = CIP 107469 TaxID=1120927 RepID=R9AW23_9GAMM|nr:hypothetical protein [Acinetobacter tandoii]EOR06454.1 hypothetical protein I593_02321 [Acinetobacter tandoii DSM 14970 = CIP 107469]
MQAFLAKFYEAVIVAMAVFLLLTLIGLGVQSWRATHYKTQLDNAELKCNQQKTDIHADYQAKAVKAAKDYQEALAKQQSTINQLSSDYESEKAKYKVKVETVTKFVDKIVERDVYRNVCSDDDGLQSINSLIKSRNTS